MDPQQQQQALNMMAGMGAAFLLFGLVITAFFVFLFWRIFSKAGLAGPLSLLVLIPGFGFIVVLCILAFSGWRVAPVPPGYELGAAYPPTPAYPPTYPTTTSSTTYPPPTYPPSGPPSNN